MNIFLAEGETYMAIGDAALFALVGFAIVIAVLFVLVLVIALISKVTNVNIKLPWKKSAVANESVTESGNIPVLVNNEAEIAAAISAAVSVILTEQKAESLVAAGAEDDVPPPFIIRSIKKI